MRYIIIYIIYFKKDGLVNREINEIKINKRKKISNIHEYVKEYIKDKTRCDNYIGIKITYKNNKLIGLHQLNDDNHEIRAGKNIINDDTLNIKMNIMIGCTASLNVGNRGFIKIESEISEICEKKDMIYIEFNEKCVITMKELEINKEIMGKTEFAEEFKEITNRYIKKCGKDDCKDMIINELKDSMKNNTRTK